MPEDITYRRMPVRVEADQATTNGGGDGGDSGGSSGSGQGGGSSSGSSSANAARSQGQGQEQENPRFQGRRDVRGMSTDSQSNTNEGEQQQPQPPRSSGGAQQSRQQEQQMSNCLTPVPAIVAGGIPSPYGYGGFGYGYPGAGAPLGGAPVTTVVTGQGNGHDQDALLGIAVDGIRESADAQRATAQGQFSLSREITGLAISNKDSTIAQLHQSADQERRLAHDVSDTRVMVAQVRDQVREESLRLSTQLNENRIRDLETRLADAREARRDDRMLDLLRDIRDRMVAPRI